MKIDNALVEKILTAVSYAVFVCMSTTMLLWFWVLSQISFGQTTPDPLSQHVVPYDNHGTYVYLTIFQDRLYHALLPTMFVFLLVWILVRFLLENCRKGDHWKKG